MTGFGTSKLPQFFLSVVVFTFLAARFCAADFQTPQSVDDRMLGGTLAPIWEGPFAFVSIDDNDATCSGVLVGPNEVLTAAHCVAGEADRPEGYAPYEYSVAVGGQIFGVVANYYNAGYRATAGATNANAQHDLGMLILSGNVTGSAPLPILSGLPVEAGEIATIFGFGANRSPSTSAFEIFYNAGERGNTEIKAASKGLIDVVYGKSHAISCPGDSGGALVQGVAGYNAAVGLVSQGTAQDKNNACVAKVNQTFSTFVDLQSAASKGFLLNFPDIQYIPGKLAVFTASLPKLIKTLTSDGRQSKSSRIASDAKSVLSTLTALKHFANASRITMLNSAIASLKRVKVSESVAASKALAAAALLQLTALEALGIS